MKKLTSIDSFKEGTQVQGFYICVEKYIRHTKSGDLYLDLELRDITGNISAKIWDNISELNSKFEKGDAVAISGYVESYLEHLQLIIRKINKATVQYYGRYGFDPVKIVPSSKKDPHKMWGNLISIVKEIKIKELQRLIFLIYKSNKKKILIHPGSIKSSYNFRSGFLEQALSMAQIAKKITPFYNLDKEIVIGGVLLIKVGVLKQIKSGYITDYSKEGNLLGQSIISRDILNNAIRKIKNFPEALLVHFIYKMNSNMNLMQRIILDDNEETDFTSIHNHFRLPVFKK